MDPHHPVWSAPALSRALDRHDLGGIVRILRHAQGLTLDQLGRRCGYSASRISRYERGQAPLTDVDLLRRFASALQVSPALFGLLPAPAPPAGLARSAESPDLRVSPPPVSSGPTVVPDPRRDQEDPVRRRQLLAGAAGAAAATALGLPRRALATPAPDLDDLLYGTATAAAPVPLDALRAASQKAHAWFRAARYAELSQALPDLLAVATASRDHAGAQRHAEATALLADAHLVASALMVKTNDDRLAWAMADRAVQAAAAAGDPLLLADARRAVATVVRRTGRPAKANQILLAAAADIEPGPHPTGDQLAMYGTLLQVAAYTAAVEGNRHTAHDLIGEARQTADRLHRAGQRTDRAHTTFSTAGVTLYQVSIAQVLGDSGAAIAHATTLRPGALPTPERQARLGIDIARAYHQWGKPDQCYRALRQVERIAPAEVRYRPPVHRMTEDLLRADQRNALPGLRAFAHRIGLPC